MAICTFFQEVEKEFWWYYPQLFSTMQKETKFIVIEVVSGGEDGANDTLYFLHLHPPPVPKQQAFRIDKFIQWAILLEGEG